MPEQQPIRVLHIITRMILGGAQENTLLTVEGLNRSRDYEVTLVSGTDRGPEGELLTRARRNAPVIVVDQLYRNLNPLDDFTALIKLRSIIRRGRYQIVHTHSSKAGVLGRIAAKMCRTPLTVHTLHGLAFHDYQPWVVNRVWRAVEKSCAPLTTHFISVSEVIKRKAMAAGIGSDSDITKIFSGMELDWFLHYRSDPLLIRKELSIPADALVIGKIARLFPLKGHDALLDAAPAIVQKYPNARFLFVGDGILRDRLQAKARGLGVMENVIFAGLVDRERIPAVLSAMDLLVHTSLREGLARALPQALAMGKPCVSYDLDGAPEVVVPGQTGFLVHPGDTVELARAILELLGNPELRRRMGEAGRRLVDPAFRAETMIQQIDATYRMLIARFPERMAAFESVSR